MSSSQTETIRQTARHLRAAQARRRLSGPAMPNKQRGFTLVELIMTMVILAILSAVALPRFLDSNAIQNRGAADQVKAALRYGQKMAIAQHRTLSVIISAPATPSCDATLDVSGNVNCAVAVAGFAATVTFNALGQPVQNASPYAPLTAPVSISAAGMSIVIEQETGYVH